jgi:ribosome-associated protein
VTAHSLRPELRCAVAAARSKQAEDVALFDLRKLGAFTDYFLICTGFSHPQLRAIADEIEEQLKTKMNVRGARREGDRRAADWVLLDYGSFVVHIFAERARLHYDLERLWRVAPRVPLSDDGAGAAGTL